MAGVLTFDRVRLERAADIMAVLVAISLPWSTSATSILVAVWLVTLLPTLDLASVCRAFSNPAGALPVLLFALAALGMAWADVGFGERARGLEAYLKLLAIPLLLVEFQRSERGTWVLYGLLASCTGLLIASWLHALFYWSHITTLIAGVRGIPVKDYISQSGFFTLSAFIILDLAADAWQARRVGIAAVLVLLAGAFLANILSIITSRTTLVVIPVLVVLLGWRRAGWKGMLGVCVAAAIIAAGSLAAFPNLRQRVTAVFTEVEIPRTEEGPSSAGARLEFWRNSIAVVEDAPLLGHGTGSIREMLHWAAAKERDALDPGATNPHNQVFAIAIQLGIVGVLVVLALWLVHLMLFTGAGLVAWAGLVIVTQNVVSSMFNSHLFDFTQGWLYAFAVGALGGTMLWQQNRDHGDHVPL